MILQIFLGVLCYLLYLIAPDKYSYPICLLLLIIFLISSFCGLKKVSHNNIFNFHILFFISFFFVNLVYPVFIYPFDKFYFPIFNIKFDHELINKSTALAVFGICSYNIGLFKMANTKLNFSETTNIPTRTININFFRLMDLTYKL